MQSVSKTKRPVPARGVPRATAAAPAAAVSASVLDSLRRIVRVLRESSRASEKKLGVSGAQLFVLKALAEAPSSSLNEVASRTRTHQSTVSVVVSGLVGRRLVSRANAAHDGRQVSLSLTASGRRLLARAPLAAQEKLLAALDALPLRQRKALADTLAQVTAAMGLEGAPVAMFFEPGPAAARGAARASTPGRRTSRGGRHVG